MNTICRSSVIAFLVVSLMTATAGEPSGILNLSEIEPLSVAVMGQDVFLLTAGRPPNILQFTNSAPSRITHPSERKAKKVQVTYGADLVGHAFVLVAPLDSRKGNVIEVRSGGSSSFVTLPKNQPQAGTSVFLSFETKGQATAAGKVLRLRNAEPSPLPIQKLPGAKKD